MLVGARDRADGLRQQYEGVVEERDHVVSRVESSTLDPMLQSVLAESSRSRPECQR